MLSSRMQLKQLLYFSLLLLLLFTSSGCTFIRMAQEGAEKIKTTSTHGYQNGIKPEEIRNLKDYIVNENDFVILAESPHKTVYKTRNESNMGRLSILDDLMDYCLEIKGEVQFGKQIARSMASEYESIDFELSSIKSDYKQYRKTGYKGWMKCVNSEDDFEVLRKRSTKYFTIYHKKAQEKGYALQWYIDYFDLEEADLNSLNIGHWSYNALVQFGGLCTYHQGTAYIHNRYTHEKKMKLDTYIIQQFNPTSKNDPYLMATGSFSCEQSQQQEADFELDIAYSKQYRKLLYTRRQ